MRGNGGKLSDRIKNAYNGSHKVREFPLKYETPTK